MYIYAPSFAESHHQPSGHAPSSSARQPQETPAVIGSTNVGTLPNVANLTSKTQQNCSPKHSGGTSNNASSNSNSSLGNSTKGCGNTYKTTLGKLAMKRDRKEGYSNNSAGNGNYNY